MDRLETLIDRGAGRGRRRRRRHDAPRRSTPAARARATITQKAPGVISGLEVAAGVFRHLDPVRGSCRLGPEGVWREAGAGVLVVEGNARALLTGERTALNFLGRLSGIATLTARVVVGGARRGRDGADPRHAQDHAGPAAAREGGGRRRRRRQPPRRALRRDPDQGEPLRARGRRGRGGAARAGGAAGPAAGGRGARRRGDRRGARGRRAAAAAGQHDARRRCATRSRAWRAARRSRCRAA